MVRTDYEQFQNDIDFFSLIDLETIKPLAEPLRNLRRHPIALNMARMEI